MTKLEKLQARLSKLEDDLFEEKCKQHAKLNNMGWGHAMRNVRCSISTKREDSIKERIEKVKKQIKELEGK